MSKEMLEWDRKNDDENIASIKRQINAMIEEYGLEEIKEMIFEIARLMKLDESDMEEDSLTDEEILRAVQREKKLKFYNRFHGGGGRKNRVKFYFESFVDFYKYDREGKCAETLKRARDELSRTSFYRLRKKIEEKYGFKPVEKFKRTKVFTKKMGTEELGDEKA